MWLALRLALSGPAPCARPMDSVATIARRRRRAQTAALRRYGQVGKLEHILFEVLTMRNAMMNAIVHIPVFLPQMPTEKIVENVVPHGERD